MLTERDFQEAAKRLNCEVAAIKAVVEVESSGSGFLTTGEIKILFEPHVWWKELIKEGKDPKEILKTNPEVSSILYFKWGQLPYGKPSEQWERLRRAAQVDMESAYKSASWGVFQILGNNHKLAGYQDVFEMVHSFEKGEAFHLDAFVNFVKNTKLDIHIQKKNWSAFASGYNGKSYKKNKYDIKLWNAYKKHKSKPTSLGG